MSNLMLYEQVLKNMNYITVVLTLIIFVFEELEKFFNIKNLTPFTL